jgi:hypothetical protein
MRLCAVVLALSLLPATARAADMEAPPSAAETLAPDGGAPPDLAPAPIVNVPNEVHITVADAQTIKARAQLQRRRHLLVWHRVLGFATLTLLAAANVLGTLNYYDKYDARGIDNGAFTGWHEGLSIGATATFGVSGVLGLVARGPDPQRQLKRGRALAHKISMAAAAVGFVAEIVLGSVAGISDGKLYQRDLAVSHVALGWATFGFLGAGVLSYVF